MLVFCTDTKHCKGNVLPVSKLETGSAFLTGVQIVPPYRKFFRVKIVTQMATQFLITNEYVLISS